MDLATFRDLLTPAGQAALAAATHARPTDAGFLAAFDALRKRYPAALAKAAVETVLLRDKGRAKFAAADRLYFTREALEQASGEVVSRYRAGRFAGFDTVLDLCCGVGADTLAFAGAGHSVEAVDHDPLRLAMAVANAAALGLTDRVRCHDGDVLTMPFPPADAAFIDPSRRTGERRFLDPEMYQPPLGAVRDRFPAGFPLAAKVAPGVARADLERYDAEADFVSAGGELKECVLWFGPLRMARRRATVLPGSHTLASDAPPACLPAAEVGAFVFDPDPSVVRADLMGLVADRLAAAAVDYGVALLTGTTPAATPFAACYRVEHAAPLHVAKLRDYLRAHGVGRVTPLKRAVDVEVNDLARKLKLAGPGHRHLILTRNLGKTVAIVAERWESGPTG